MLMPILLFLTSMMSITWSLVFLFGKPFDISIYKVIGHKMQQFIRNVSTASIWNNDEPEGWIIGKWYIGYIYKKESGRGDNTMELYIICSKKYYEENINKSTDNDNGDNGDGENNTKKQKRKITFYEKDGSGYWNIYYISRTISPPTFTPHEYQSSIVSNIHADYISRNYTVVLLYGPPGKGKSIIPHFLANYMLNSNECQNKYKKISLLDTFNPIQPGDKFSSIYTKINPSKETPLIIVLEEVDIIIDKIHNNTIIPHKDIPCLVSNKMEWNMFLDRFDRGLYPYVIFIMTTNKTPEYFNNLDASYLRQNRINASFQV